MVSRKMTRSSEPKEKKPRKPRVKKLKRDISGLPDAFPDDGTQPKVGDKVIFERSRHSTNELHEGYIKKIDADVVTVWDDTAGQWHLIDPKQRELAFKLLHAVGNEVTNDVS